ncbi:hypothetical protein C8R44DRAFT_864665 [Mycena epipterygia]|nr:hypothetical protein C8R44DRAFT_864665 [Mycena epipterygia]
MLRLEPRAAAAAQDTTLSTSQLNENECILGSCDTERQTPGFTDMRDSSSLGWSTTSESSYPPPNSTIVAGILFHLSKAETQANLEHFTSYHMRYFDSDIGKASSEWFYANILTYAAELASEKKKRLISVEEIEHPWKQNSLVIRIASLNACQFAPITILGAHIDTLNHGGIFLAAPGADDDGSGIMTILETYRAFAGELYPSPLEFHFYAGEEGGLRGSHAIASTYALGGRKAWHQAGTREEIGVTMNNVDAAFSEFQILLTERYRQFLCILVDRTTYIHAQFKFLL